MGRKLLLLVLFKIVDRGHANSKCIGKMHNDLRILSGHNLNSLRAIGITKIMSPDTSSDTNMLGMAGVREVKLKNC